MEAVTRKESYITAFEMSVEMKGIENRKSESSAELGCVSHDQSQVTEAHGMQLAIKIGPLMGSNHGVEMLRPNFERTETLAE